MRKTYIFPRIKFGKLSQSNLALIISMSSVLTYLHCDQKIIHRDLNPSNIMIDTNFNIKLADFGLAKSFQNSVSAMKSFVGTLVYSRFYYMSR